MATYKVKKGEIPLYIGTHDNPKVRRHIAECALCDEPIYTSGGGIQANNGERYAIPQGTKTIAMECIMMLVEQIGQYLDTKKE